MSSLALDSMVQRRGDVIGNVLSDREHVMLDLERGRYFGVQDVGNTIWAELTQPVSVNELCVRLCHRFEIDEVTCRAEVLEFLQQLLAAGLIDAQPSDAAR